MSANASVRVFNVSIDRCGGADWYRLHAERENVCEALLKEFRPEVKNQPGPLRLSQEDIECAQTWHRDLLQGRLTKIDEALDRLMAGSYGECITCGRWIQDAKLDVDPAVAFCVPCWERLQTVH